MPHAAIRANATKVDFTKLFFSIQGRIYDVETIWLVNILMFAFCKLEGTCNECTDIDPGYFFNIHTIDLLDN